MNYYEIDAQQREFDTLLEEFRQSLRKINNFHADDRRAKLHECAQIEQQIKTVRNAYNLELKALEDGDMKNRYHEALREKNLVYRHLAAELEHKKNEIDREQLNAEAEERDEANGDMMTTQLMIQQGDQIQDQTQESINRMKHLVADAEQVGLATAVKMDEQTNQMTRISEGLNDVEYNIQRAQKTAKTMAKNAASDRCIQVLCVSIIVCIIVIVILAATKK